VVWIVEAEGGVSVGFKLTVGSRGGGEVATWEGKIGFWVGFSVGEGEGSSTEGADVDMGAMVKRTVLLLSSRTGKLEFVELIKV
jgi:hypothetical protein